MQNKISKQTQIGPFGETLRQARLAKGLSQRALSARSHMTQAHISRIENGEIDLQLSSLIELARTLDLDVQLIPRAALTAVEATVRSTEERSGERTARRLLRHLRERAEQLRNQDRKRQEFIDLGEIAVELERLAPLIRTRAMVDELRTALIQLDNLGADPGVWLRRTRGVVSTLRQIRSSLVHAPHEERPAYSLSDEED